MTCACCGLPAPGILTIPTFYGEVVPEGFPFAPVAHVRACRRCSSDWHGGVNHGRHIPYAPPQLLAGGAGI